MTDQEAATILELLAQGVDPQTGGAITTQGVLGTPSVIRALFIAARRLRGAAQQPMALASETPQRPQTLSLKDPVVARQGKTWSPQETRLLLTAFDVGVSIFELARRHRRTDRAIAARLVRIGRIKERDDAYLTPRQAPTPAPESQPKSAASAREIASRAQAPKPTSIPPLEQPGELFSDQTSQRVSLVKAIFGVDTGRSTQDRSDVDRP